MWLGILFSAYKSDSVCETNRREEQILFVFNYDSNAMAYNRILDELTKPTHSPAQSKRNYNEATKAKSGRDENDTKIKYGSAKEHQAFHTIQKKKKKIKS